MTTEIGKFMSVSDTPQHVDTSKDKRTGLSTGLLAVVDKQQTGVIYGVPPPPEPSASSTYGSPSDTSAWVSAAK